MSWRGGTVAGRISLDDRETGTGFREPWDIEPQIKPEALSDINALLTRDCKLDAVQEMVTRHRVCITGELTNNRIQKARLKVAKLRHQQLFAEAKTAAVGELQEPDSFININCFTVHALLVDALLAVGDTIDGDGPRTPRRASSWVDSIFAHMLRWKQRFGEDKLADVPPIRHAAEALDQKLGNMRVEDIRWSAP